MARLGFLRIDMMVRMLILAIVCATFLPATGAASDVARSISDVAIFVLFLLNGMRLARADVVAGVRDWRFLGAMIAWCFGAMALVGMALSIWLGNALPGLVALGFLYLGCLPSTVQSATAYTSLAGGSVAASVVTAAVLNLLAVFVTVPLFSVLGGGDTAQLGWSGLVKIFAILIFPFALGQILQIRFGGWVRDNTQLITWMDRLAIAIAVYVAFSGAVEQGLWTRVSPASWLALLAGIAAFLTFAFLGAWGLGGVLALPRAERISFLFAGAQKSTAMGAPLALVLFPPEIAGLVLVPLLVYHLLQLVISAPLASRFREAHPLPPHAG